MLPLGQICSSPSLVPSSRFGLAERQQPVAVSLSVSLFPPSLYRLTFLHLFAQEGGGEMTGGKEEEGRGRLRLNRVEWEGERGADGRFGWIVDG